MQRQGKDPRKKFEWPCKVTAFEIVFHAVDIWSSYEHTSEETNEEAIEEASFSTPPNRT